MGRPKLKPHHPDFERSAREDYPGLLLLQHLVHLAEIDHLGLFKILAELRGDFPVHEPLGLSDLLKLV